MTLPWSIGAPRFSEVEIERDVPAEMHDGTILYSDIYRPVGLQSAPVLLVRTPYNKTTALTSVYAHPVWYARFGYMVVVQDTRGRWKSEGEWYPFRHEIRDGRDTIKWAAKLPGGNGKIATYGFSYCGVTQLMAAVNSLPELVTMMPAMTASDYFDGWTYKGGALQLAFARNWAWYLAHESAHRRSNSVQEEELLTSMLTAPLQYWTHTPALLECEGPAPYYYDWVTHDTYDEYWKQWSLRTRYAEISTPALHIGGWYDIFLEGVIENFVELKKQAANEFARNNQKLIIGPWHHLPWTQKVGTLDFGSNARSAMDALQVLWLDKYMQGEHNQLDDESCVWYFLMGSNSWCSSTQWPPEGVQPVKFYLHSDGRANSITGSGSLNHNLPHHELSDVWVCDPNDPVPSLGGHSCCIEGLAPMGSADQRPIENRNDVLVFSTNVLEQDLQITGSVHARLYIATTAVDTDISIRLVDVYPDGKAINLLEGHQRARFRNSLEKPEHLEPDRVYEYDIKIGTTACVFKAGHRIRIDLCSSNFPSFERNSNSGKPIVRVKLSDFTVSTQTLFHDSARPSHVTLPVLSPS